MKNSRTISLLLLLVVLTSACGGAKTADQTYPEPEALLEPTASPVYPEPGASVAIETGTAVYPSPYPELMSGLYPYPYPLTGPYPVPDPNSIVENPAFTPEGYIPPATSIEPTATPVPPIVVPTPNAGFGNVTGVLLSSDSGNPPYMATLYLGSTIKADREGFPPMVSLSTDTDPLGIQDLSGKFLFTDVKPGTYAILVWDPLNSIVILDEQKKNYLLLEVKASEITDLGTILFP